VVLLGMATDNRTEWIELAQELKDVVNVAEVNCDAHGAVCRNAGIEGYPTVAL